MRETGTGQQVAKFHERLMMMMMIMIMMYNLLKYKLLFLASNWWHVVTCDVQSAYVSCLWAQEPSRNVPADAGFVGAKAAMLRETIKGTPCTILWEVTVMSKHCVRGAFYTLKYSIRLWREPLNFGFQNKLECFIISRCDWPDFLV